MYSDKKYLHHQYFCQTTNWPGGWYASPTIAGDFYRSEITVMWFFAHRQQKWRQYCRLLGNIAAHWQKRLCVQNQVDYRSNSIYNWWVYWFLKHQNIFCMIYRAQTAQNWGYYCNWRTGDQCGCIYVVYFWHLRFSGSNDQIGLEFECFAISFSVEIYIITHFLLIFSLIMQYTPLCHWKTR